MQVKDVLTDNVCYVSPQTSLEDVAKKMKDHECGAIPVEKNDKMIGMVTDRDIVIRCVAASQDPQTMTAEQCMSPGMLYCYDTDEVESVLRNMGENAVKRLPVVNKDKNLVGIVSFGDLSAACDNKASSGEAMENIQKAA